MIRYWFLLALPLIVFFSNCSPLNSIDDLSGGIRVLPDDFQNPPSSSQNLIDRTNPSGSANITNPTDFMSGRNTSNKVSDRAGTIMGVALTPEFVDQLGDVGGSWYYNYAPHPNRKTSAGYVNTARWANRYGKEFVMMISTKRFKYAEGDESCALIPEFRNNASDVVCKINDLVQAVEDVKGLFFSSNRPQYMIVFNEPFHQNADAPAGVYSPKMLPEHAAKAWGVVQNLASRTGLKLISPSTTIDNPRALDWLANFLKHCHDLKDSASYPCDVESIYAINTHGYNCTSQYWVTSYQNKGLQNELISRMGSYGGRNWRSYLMSRKVWLTETTCNWDKDFLTAQNQGRYVRSSKEACLRATGQRAGYGSLRAITSMSADGIERFAWWTNYLNPHTHTDVNAITESSINRISAARIFDDNWEVSPVGRAYIQAINNPAGLASVDCLSLNRYLSHHYQCEYTLQGQKGNQWRVNRKSLIDSNCQVASHSISLNSPNAKTVGTPKKIFVGADNGLADDRNKNAHTKGDYWQCRFELQGTAGNRWTVYRNTDIDDNCEAARKKVRESNPGATIVSGPVRVYVGGDNGFANPNSKAHKLGEYWECHFEITGAQGATWNVIRRTDIDDNCQAAIAKVRSQNPKASNISAPVKIFSGMDI